MQIRNNVEIEIGEEKLKDYIGSGTYAKIVAEMGAMAGAVGGGVVTGKSTGKPNLLLSLLQVLPWWKSQKVFEKHLDGQGGAKAHSWWIVDAFRRYFGGGNGRAWVYGGSRHFAVIYAGKAVLKVKDRGDCSPARF